MSRQVLRHLIHRQRFLILLLALGVSLAGFYSYASVTNEADELVPIRGTRFMTERFSVLSSPAVPLRQVPPQPGFLTTMSQSAEVKVKDQRGRWVGTLSPITDERQSPTPEEPNSVAASESCDPGTRDCGVCLVTETHANRDRQKDRRLDMSRRGLGKRVDVPPAGLESFICAVSYHLDMFGTQENMVVTGPRIVRINETYMDRDDNRWTTPIEIVEMYLSGYNSRGDLVTVRGGRNFGLPPLPGEIKSLSSSSYFPASLQFDLEMEIAVWKN